MNLNEIDARLTTMGRLKLLAPDLAVLEELADAGDRGAFHSVCAVAAGIFTNDPNSWRSGRKKTWMHSHPDCVRAHN